MGLFSSSLLQTGKLSLCVYCKACKKSGKFERFARAIFTLIESGEGRRSRVYCKQTGWKY